VGAIKHNKTNAVDYLGESINIPGLDKGGNNANARAMKPIVNWRKSTYLLCPSPARPPPSFHFKWCFLFK